MFTAEIAAESFGYHRHDQLVEGDVLNPCPLDQALVRGSEEGGRGTDPLDCGSSLRSRELSPFLLRNVDDVVYHAPQLVDGSLGRIAT